MAFAKFQKNRFRIDGEIAENHAILVNLTASIAIGRTPNIANKVFRHLKNIYWLNFFFISIQPTKMSGDLQV